jgi:DNA polymerase-4
MNTLTRSATMPYATTEAGPLIAVARRLLLDPLEIGPIRLLGVGFSGLSDVRQESLFPDLELSALQPDVHSERAFGNATETATAAMFGPGPEATPWRIGDDVVHPDFGHGWVQGAGHGVVTVRFETRGSGPGQARTFAAGTGDITGANPVDSLDWPDYVGALQVSLAEASAETSAPAADDVGDG